MRPGVLCAVAGPAEPALVAALDAAGTGLTVVRRCADLPEVVAAALAGVGRVAVLGSGLGGLDRSVLARVREAGLGVVILAEPGEVERVRSLGAAAVLADDTPAEDVVRAVRAVVDGLETSATAVRVPRPGADRHTAPDAATEVDLSAPESARAARRGRVVAVWGPHGAPGRTTVAVNLAAELAALGEEALVVDADTWGGCVGQSLGLLDESPGLAAAARAAAHGTLDDRTLDPLCPPVEPGLRVLTGLTRPDRWRELSPAALDVVWEVARTVVDWAVVDCGFSLEDEVGAGFEAMLGPRRNGATLSALAAADVVVVVGTADPVGIHRLVQGLVDLAEVGVPAPGARRVLAVTRVRAGTAGPRPEAAVTEAVVRYAGVEAPLLIPDDRPAYDRALLAGATLRAVAPQSPARAVLASLAADLVGRQSGRRERRRAGRAGSARD